MTLDELVDALSVDADGNWSVGLPDNWGQGRTAYRGITAALGAAVARRLVEDLPPLRSAQIAFVGPLGGQIAFRPALLRRGRSAAFVRVDALADGQVGGAMIFVFADDRESVASRPPVAEPVEQGELMHLPDFIRFAHNFDQWFAAGAADPLDRFVRLREPSRVAAEVELLAAADLLPPPALFDFPNFVPLSSMTWQIDLVAPARRSPDRRWRIKSEGESLDHGLATQSMAMWDGDGSLVARGRQLVALFG